MASNSITLRVDGIEELRKEFENLGKEGRTRVRRAININAVEYKRAVVKSLRKRTGRHKRYRSRKDGSRWHWSSSPKRAPNSDTGNLAKKVMVTQRATNSSLGAIVVSGAKYSQALEFGHKIRPRRGALVTVRRAPSTAGPANRRVAPRPFMFPMFKKMRRVFVARIREAIKGAL